MSAATADSGPVVVHLGEATVGRAESAYPVPVPVGPTTDHSPRCRYCGRKIAYYATRPWRIKCGKCGAVTSAEAAPPEAPLRPPGATESPRPAPGPDPSTSA